MVEKLVGNEVEWNLHQHLDTEGAPAQIDHLQIALAKPFLVLQAAMTHEQIADSFLPISNGERRHYIGTLARELVYDCRVPYKTHKQENPQKIDEIARTMVFLTKIKPSVGTACEQDIASAEHAFYEYIQPWVRHMVKKGAVAADKVKDAEQEGLIALASALPRYDLSERDVTVLQFAKKRVKGAIIDSFRHTCSSVYLGKKTYRVARGMLFLREDMPLQELSAVLEVSEKRVQKAQMALRFMNAVSFEVNGVDVAAVCDAEKSTEDPAVIHDLRAKTLEESLFLKRAFDLLDYDDFILVALRFGFYSQPPMLLKDIATVYGRGESAMSYRLKKILAQMRATK